MLSLMADVHEVLRHLRRSPGFAALGIALLALGIGATTSVFSLLYSLVLQPLPFPAPERLVGIQALNPSKAVVQDFISVTDARDLVARSRSFSAAGAFRPNFAAYTRPDETALRLVTGLITPGLLEALAVKPLLGRAFALEEFSFTTTRTVILSHAAWQRLFQGDPLVLGQTMLLDDEPCTVIGVMPEQFREPAFVDAWLPFPNESPEYFARDSRFWTMIGRLAPGVTAAAAHSELSTIAANLAREYPDTNRDWTVAAVPLSELRTRGLRHALFLLVAAVGLVLLVACLNLANLLLARSLVRLPELGVRVALGATPHRLAFRVFLEGWVLATVGAALGCLAAAVALPILSQQLPPSLVPRAHEITLHPVALGLACGLAVLSAGICSLLPIVQLLRTDINVLLKDGAARGTVGRHATRWQAILVTSQIALTVAVVAGALLLMKSLVRLQSVPIGFDPTDVIALRLSPPPNRYTTTAELARYYDDLIEAVAATPGVRSVAINASVPLGGITLTYPTWTDGRTRDAASAHQAVYAPISDRFFATLRIPLREGRVFTSHDHRQGAPVVVVNEAYVRRAFPDGRVIGRRILLLPWAGEIYREIVGVVADTRQENLSSPPPPQVYVPQQQLPWFFSTLVVRLEQPGVTTAVQQALRRADPTLPFAPTLLTDTIAQSATQPRLYAALFAMFAITTLTLSAFGLYASLRFALNQRIRDIGVRMALGATPSSIVAWMLAHAGRLVAGGGAVGVVGALVLASALRSQLYGVEALDPWTFALLPALVAGTASLAALPIALRAGRLNPVSALQHD
jgi:predicted permease